MAAILRLDFEVDEIATWGQVATVPVARGPLGTSSVITAAGEAPAMPGWVPLAEAGAVGPGTFRARVNHLWHFVLSKQGLVGGYSAVR